MTSHIKHLVFDFGDVLNYHLRTKEEKQALLDVADMPPEVFFTRYWKHRTAYDLGQLDADQYWNLVLDNPCPSKVKTLRQIDVQVAVRLNFRVWVRLRQLRAKPLTLTLLSNMPSDLARYHEHSSIHDNFHHTFFSCDIGMMKPDPRVYDFVLQKTGQTAGETLLVDDSSANVAAAREAGWRAIRFRSIKHLVELLDRVYNLPLSDFRGS